MLSKTGLINAKSLATPMEERPIAPENDSHLYGEEITEFQEICGGLIWLLRTRYDIAYAVGIICSQMAKPTNFSVKQARKILRYLAGTPRRGLTYHPLNTDEDLDTYAYCDESLVGSNPHIGVAVFLGKCDRKTHINKSAAIIVHSKRRKIVTVSTMHAALDAIELALRSCRFVTDFRNEMGYIQDKPSIIFTDNQPAIHFLTGDGSTAKDLSRHLRRRYDHIREAINQNHILLDFVPTNLNCADALTKPLGRILFERHNLNLMGCISR